MHFQVGITLVKQQLSMQIELEISWDVVNQEWQCYFQVGLVGGAIIKPTLKDVEDELRETVDNILENGDASNEYLHAPINWSVMEEELESFKEYVKQASEEQKEELRVRKLLD